MEITIKINGRMVSVEVSDEVATGSNGGGGKSAERQGRGIVRSENGALIHRVRCRAPCRGLLLLPPIEVANG